MKEQRERDLQPHRTIKLLIAARESARETTAMALREHMEAMRSEALDPKRFKKNVNRRHAIARRFDYDAMLKKALENERFYIGELARRTGDNVANLGDVIFHKPLGGK